MARPALTFSFHDTAHDLHGTVRSGMTLLFQGGQPSTMGMNDAVGGDGREAAFPGMKDGLQQRVSMVYSSVHAVLS